MPGIASRLSHVAAKSYCIVEARRKWINAQQVSIAKRAVKPGVIQRERLCLPAFVILNSLQQDPAFVGQICRATRIAQSRSNGLVTLDLVDSGLVDAADDRHLLLSGRNIDHVAGQELNIMRLVASAQ